MIAEKRTLVFHSLGGSNESSVTFAALRHYMWGICNAHSGLKVCMLLPACLCYSASALGCHLGRLLS